MKAVASVAVAGFSHLKCRDPVIVCIVAAYSAGDTPCGSPEAPVQVVDVLPSPKANRRAVLIYELHRWVSRGHP